MNRKNPFTHSPIHPFTHSFKFCKSGFTLLEIMIALAVIGGLLVTLMYTLNYNLGIVERHETITIASLLAKEKINETGSISERIKGVFSEPYQDYSYEIEVNESPYIGVSELSVTVRRDKESVIFSKLIRNEKITEFSNFKF